MGLLQSTIVLKAKDLTKAVFDKAKENIKGTGAEAEKGAVGVDKLGASVKKLSTAERKLAIEQKKLENSTEKVALEQKKLDQSTNDLNRAYTQANTSEQKAAIRRKQLANDTRQLSLDSKKLSNEQKQLNITAKKAAIAQKGLEKNTKSLGGILKSTTSRVVAFGAAYLGLNKLKEGFLAILDTGGKFETLKVQLEAVMGTVEGGEAAFAWIENFTKNTPLQLDGVTNAFVKMKALGLDPMDGTMQKLTDISSKLGGGQERLEGIILGVGQAWTKGKLQAEEANQLIERGVPVWDLMSKAIGKTTAELQVMARKGQLGREQIKLLIDEIGASSEGAAQAQMKTWAGVISNLQDTWTTFLNTIAESGALDYFKTELQDLSATISAMAKDGSLKVWASDISLAITTTAEIVKGTVSIFRIAFNGIQVAVGTLAIRFVDATELMLKAMAALTWGDWSKGFESAATEMGLMSDSLAKGVEKDANEMFSAFENLSDQFTSTAKVSKTTSDSIVKDEAAKKKAAVDASAAIKTANKEAAASAEQVAKATSLLKTDLNELKGTATDLGKGASSAFKTLANEAGLTGAQIANAAEKALNLAKTTGDIDLLKQSFEDVGFEVGKHPKLVQAIIDKIISLGGSIDDIPQKLRDVASAAKDTENSMKAGNENLITSDNKRHKNRLNNISAEEAAYIAAVQRQAEADKKAYEDKEKRRLAPVFNAFDKETSESYSGLNSQSLALLQKAQAEDSARPIHTFDSAAFVKILLERQNSNAGTASSVADTASSVADTASSVADTASSVNEESTDNNAATNISDEKDYSHAEREWLDYIEKERLDYIEKERRDYIEKERRDYIEKERLDYIEKERRAYLSEKKTIHLNFKANDKSATANFNDQQSADDFIDILKTAGSVT